MKLNRSMVEILIQEGVKTTSPNIIGEISIYNEWIKWLSYVPEFDKDKIKKYKKQKRLVELFKKYGTKDITIDEYIEVFEFMQNNDIEKFMKRKLTKEELQYAKRQIKHYNNVSNKELEYKINNEKEEDNYKKLSMVDAYILHNICIMSSINSSINLCDDIENQSKNTYIPSKGLYYASNPYGKKL